jgi:hypothetical protein
VLVLLVALLGGTAGGTNKCVAVLRLTLLQPESLLSRILNGCSSKADIADETAAEIGYTNTAGERVVVKLSIKSSRDAPIVGKDTLAISVTAADAVSGVSEFKYSWRWGLHTDIHKRNQDIEEET